jgi:hypothetical protein
MIWGDERELEFGESGGVDGAGSSGFLVSDFAAAAVAVNFKDFGGVR